MSSDASPAAAAQASKWPIFALSDVHCALRQPRERQEWLSPRTTSEYTAAPTCKMRQSYKTIDHKYLILNK